MSKDSLYDYAAAGDFLRIRGVVAFASLDKPSESPSQFEEGEAYGLTLADPEVVKASNKDLEANALRPNAEMAHGTYVSSKGRYAGHTMWSFRNSPKAKQAPALVDLKTGKTSTTADYFTAPVGSGQPMEVYVEFYEYNYNGRRGISASIRAVAVPDVTEVRYAGDGAEFASFFDVKPNGRLENPAPASAPVADDSADQADEPAPTSSAPTEDPNVSTTPESTPAEKTDKEAINSAVNKFFSN